MMSRTWLLPACLFVACVFVASNARADASPQRPSDLPTVVTLGRTLDLLRERSPQSKADRARLDVVAAERVEASIYPNPSLSYGGLALAHGARVAPTWQHQIVVEQPVLLFGQRGARQEIADLSLRAERAEVTASFAERSLQVSQAFFSLLARQHHVELLEESLADLEGLEQIVRGRMDAGDRSRYDLTRFEIETNTVRIELRNARTEVEEAAGTLAALLGFPGWQPKAEGSLDPSLVPTDIEQLWDIAQRKRPSIQAARARQAAARGGLGLARRERLPVPAVALGTLLTQDEKSASVFFGLSVPVPVFDRGQGAMARATASIQAESRGAEAELARARAELERARTVYLRQRDTLNDIDQHMIQRIPALRKMAEDSYLGGNSGILELLDAHRSVNGIRRMHLEQREAVKQAEASVIAAAGLEPLTFAGE